jgi:hypothetical protein
MSTLYAFCIGGTGALCLESLVHLCASGQGPAKLVPVLMDPDSNNANVSRVVGIINQYREIRQSLDPSHTGGYFGTVIEPAEGTLTWSPLPKRLNPTLADVVRIRSMDQALRDLTETLFSHAQLNQPLEQGFRGNPAIGSVLMQSIEDEPFFANIAGKIKNDPDAAVYLFGSVFGGTGASGFPVTARLIRTRVPDARIGGALILPYFSIGQPNGNDQESLLRPESAQFLLNTIGALPYYSKEDTSFDSLYYLGDDLSMAQERPYAAGGPEQLGRAHCVEMLAALGSLHFLKTPKDDLESAYYAGAQARNLGWNDLPGLDAAKLNSFTSFGIFIREYFAKGIQANINELERDAFKQTWIADLKLPATFFRDSQQFLQRLAAYLEAYFQWLGEMHASTVALDLYHPPFQIDRYQKHHPPRRRRIMGFPSGKPDFLGSISEVHRFCNGVARAANGGGDVTRFIDHARLGMDEFNREWYQINAPSWSRTF